MEIKNYKKEKLISNFTLSPVEINEIALDDTDFILVYIF